MKDPLLLIALGVVAWWYLGKPAAKDLQLVEVKDANGNVLFTHDPLRSSGAPLPQPVQMIGGTDAQRAFAGTVLVPGGFSEAPRAGNT